MRLESIQFSNFKSFLGKHEIDFTDRQFGLYFVTGENQVEPQLGANGAGKSTILDALSWGLYGKTLRSLRAGNVFPWAANAKEGTKVVIKFVNATDTQHVLERTWHPNALRLDGKTVDEEAVITTAGLSYEAFCHSIIIGQFNRVFFDLAPSAKLQLLSDILDLELWTRTSTGASAEAKAQDQAERKAESQLAKVKGKIEEIGTQIVTITEKAEQFEEERQLLIEELRGERDKHSTSLTEYTDKLSKIDAELDELRRYFVSLEEKMRLLSREGQMLDHDLHELAAEKRRCDGLIDAQADHFKRLKSMGAMCSICNQPISDDHLDGEQHRLRAQRSELFKEMAALQTKYLQVEIDRNTFTVTQKQIVKERDAKYRRRDHCQQRAGEHRKRIGRLEAQVESDELRIQEQVERDNPYEQQIAECRRMLSDYKKEAKQHQQTVEDAATRRTACEYWAKGFKQIRLFVVEEAIQYLEVETNNALLALGLKDYVIRLDVERETKSGSMSKGFHVFVSPPDGPKDVPWEAWSGGETQRLRMAGALGLSNLILNSTGVVSNFLGVDEPTTHLGQEGITALLGYLEQMSYDTEKSIFLIDHHALDYGGFAGTINVIKTDTGSHIEET